MNQRKWPAGPQLCDPDKAAEITGISDANLRNRLIREGEYPQPVKINARTKLWVEAELYDWVHQRIDARNAGFMTEDEWREAATRRKEG